MMKNKRARTSVDKAVVDVWQREVGKLSTRNFAHRLAASEDLVLRLDIYKKLVKHQGCVNTVSFNSDGNILVSGSDDKRVIVWDWETGNSKLSFQSGHVSNVFQAKIMPYTDDRSLVTCAADGQVRHAQILECGVETRLLAKHQGQAHNLAIEPGSPHIFYTCGEDGLVQHIDLRTAAPTKLFTCSHIDDSRAYMPVIPLNAIAIDPRNPNLFAVAGMDYFRPPHLIGDDQAGITGLAFSDQSEILVTYINEFIYLFTQDMGLGPNPVPSSPLSAFSEASEMGFDHSAMDADEKAIPQVYKGHRNQETVKGVSFFGPKSEYVISMWSTVSSVILIPQFLPAVESRLTSRYGHQRLLIKLLFQQTLNRRTTMMMMTLMMITMMFMMTLMMITITMMMMMMMMMMTTTMTMTVTMAMKMLMVVMIVIAMMMFKPKPRSRMYQVTTPQDLMLRLFSLQRRGSSPEQNGENSSIAGGVPLELVLSFNANSDASSDGGGNASGPEDLFS